MRELRHQGGHGIIIQLSCCLMSGVLCAGLVALVPTGSGLGPSRYGT
jgi:hypothetical protein